MAKLTLDQTWRKCMPMWRWIGAQIKAGSQETVEALKLKWLHAHDPDVDLNSGCYFCEYDMQHQAGKFCSKCPGVLVDNMFQCENDEYDYRHNPLAFLAKLESLYVKYKAAKKRAGKVPQKK